MDTLRQEIYFLIIKINNFWGDLSGIAAKTASLIHTHPRKTGNRCCVVGVINGWHGGQVHAVFELQECEALAYSINPDVFRGTEHHTASRNCAGDSTLTSCDRNEVTSNLVVYSERPSIVCVVQLHLPELIREHGLQQCTKQMFLL